jgi:SAM-dependent methyltransferase
MFTTARYFFYLGFNWNFRIAWYIIKEEIKGEKKYGIQTTGVDELKALEKKGIDIDHATIYMPVSYGLLEDCLLQLNQLRQNNSLQKLHRFLDIGCGKGRALCIAAQHDFTSVTGVDFSKTLCLQAERNLAITRQKIPGLDFKVINNDAFYFIIPNDVDCIFLFNPFDEVIMSGVIENILTSLLKSPRNMYIIYINPIHKDIFTAAGFRQKYHIQKMKYLEAVILFK